MNKPTWRSRNPDKYRECQAATMRRRRAAAKLAAGPTVDVGIVMALADLPADAVAGQPVLDQPVTGPVGRVDVPAVSEVERAAGMAALQACEDRAAEHLPDFVTGQIAVVDVAEALEPRPSHE